MRCFCRFLVRIFDLEQLRFFLLGGEGKKKGDQMQALPLGFTGGI